MDIQQFRKAILEYAPTRELRVGDIVAHRNYIEERDGSVRLRYIGKVTNMTFTKADMLLATIEPFPGCEINQKKVYTLNLIILDRSVVDHFLPSTIVSDNRITSNSGALFEIHSNGHGAILPFTKPTQFGENWLDPGRDARPSAEPKTPFAGLSPNEIHQTLAGLDAVIPPDIMASLRTVFDIALSAAEERANAARH